MMYSEAGILSWIGFRAGGRDQRAFRSPFGNLRTQFFYGYAICHISSSHALVVAVFASPHPHPPPKGEGRFCNFSLSPAGGEVGERVARNENRLPPAGSSGQGNEHSDRSTYKIPPTGDPSVLFNQNGMISIRKALPTVIGRAKVSLNASRPDRGRCTASAANMRRGA